MHLSIDADGSPTGLVAWYNHRTDRSRIRNLRPMIKNSNYAVQRMEMLAIYFALLDNHKYLTLTRFVKRTASKNLNVHIRSDSKSTIEQLIGKSEIKDALIHRIYDSINRLLHRIPQSIKFSHVRRRKNIAGILLDEKRNKRYSFKPRVPNGGYPSIPATKIVQGTVELVNGHCHRVKAMALQRMPLEWLFHNMVPGRLSR